MGHNSFVYLDNGFGSQPERTSAVAAAYIQWKDLASSGFLVNEEKSHWSQCKLASGSVLWSTLFLWRFRLRLLNSAIQNKSSSYCKLTWIAGSIVSVVLAVWPISCLLTRQMHLAIESRSAWDHISLFPPALLEELKFWFCNIESFNGYSIRQPLDSSTVVFSNARDAAFGGFSASLVGTVASGTFTIEDLGQSSTFRELKATFESTSFLKRFH